MLMDIAPATFDERMPALRMNQVGESTLGQENISLLSNLNPIFEVEEEDDDIVTSMSTPSGQQLGPENASRKQRYMWYCCQCGDGPSDVDYVSCCTECYHRRCGACSVKTKRT
jgi:hypothetical protein